MIQIREVHLYFIIIIRKISNIFFAKKLSQSVICFNKFVVSYFIYNYSFVACVHFFLNFVNCADVAIWKKQARNYTHRKRENCLFGMFKTNLKNKPNYKITSDGTSFPIILCNICKVTSDLYFTILCITHQTWQCMLKSSLNINQITS